jgi:hypothetical protein
MWYLAVHYTGTKNSHHPPMTQFLQPSPPNHSTLWISLIRLCLSCRWKKGRTSDFKHTIPTCALFTLKINIKSNYFYELKFLGNTKARSNAWGCDISRNIPLCGVALLQNYCNFLPQILPDWHPPIQTLRTASIFSLILKIIQISLLA